MMTRNWRGVVVGGGPLAAVRLAGNGRQSVYWAVQFDNEVGYTARAIELDRWRVGFVAPEKWDPARTKDFALLRAAGLTVETGRRHFVVYEVMEVMASAGIRQPVRLSESGGDDAAQADDHAASHLADGNLMVSPEHFGSWAVPRVMLKTRTTNELAGSAAPETRFQAEPLIAKLRANYGLGAARS